MSLDGLRLESSKFAKGLEKNESFQKTRNNSQGNLLLDVVSSSRNLSSFRTFLSRSDSFKQHFANILEGCSDICNTTIVGKNGIFFQQLTKNVNCSALWQNAAIDQSRPIGPAPEVPPEFKNFFDYNGRVRMRRWSGGLLNQQYSGGKAKSPVWKQDQIDMWADECGKGTLNGNYGLSATRSVYEGLLKMNSLQGGHVLVLGSEIPWIEACILRAGARHVTTIEYGVIVSEHPRVSTMTPHDARNAYLSEKLPVFDAIVSFSSLEHSGLGRYGDQLNPWGDLQAVARAWCLCKKGGQMLMGVPEAKQDGIEWNAHRVYGPVMFPHLTANWVQVWRGAPDFQRPYVFQKDAV
eukprot:CAMPEP_0173085158 /NCGR_PEP_ID=MMETSP1102-20130122/21318_1 /TAXON_ID=49646 /ORGANISM="Geminigera sp., Strain Caron Lab Isolate" /LENGTH=350 /DNA_ID=CAMNT_0013964109 /DNA_START=335 /DNA_END=1387 /DNA_ORIENTATION=+